MILKLRVIFFSFEGQQLKFYKVKRKKTFKSYLNQIKKC